MVAVNVVNGDFFHPNDYKSNTHTLHTGIQILRASKQYIFNNIEMKNFLVETDLYFNIGWV